MMSNYPQLEKVIAPSHEVSYTKISGVYYLKSEKNQKIIRLGKAESDVWEVILERSSLHNLKQKTIRLNKEKLFYLNFNLNDFLSQLTAFGAIEYATKYNESHVKDINERTNYEKYLDDFSKKKIIPLSAFVEVTHICNERCIHCANPTHKTQGLSLDLYENLFKELKTLGTLNITFTGGEPFVRKDFFDILGAARRLGLSVRIYTNATLIDAQKIKHLKEMGIRQYDISLYGATSKTHDYITQRPMSFEKTIKNIILLKDSGMHILLKCPVMTSNYGELEQIHNLATELGLPIRFYPRITSKSNGVSTPCNLRLSQSELNAFFKTDFIKESAVSRYFQARQSYVPTMCSDVMNLCSIDPSGDVRLCGELNIVGGNILKETILHIWNKSESFKNVRNLFNIEAKECSHCGLNHVCNRCPGLALREDGDVLGCCSIARAEAQAFLSSLN